MVKSQKVVNDDNSYFIILPDPFIGNDNTREAVENILNIETFEKDLLMRSNI